MIDIQTILSNHKKWLNDEDGGKRADLHNADLRDANLRGVNLMGANLQAVHLQRANLQETNLQGADLRRANLRRANLRDADLQGADLRDADLWHADLRDVSLQRANLQNVDWDYSSGLPLWCGGRKFTCSLKFIYQILSHLYTLKVDESEQAEFNEILEKICPYALKSHRARDLGLLNAEGTSEQKDGGTE